MNTAAKGRHMEHRSRRLLDRDGYAVTRSAGSKGAWDLIAVNATEIVLLQVKSNRPPAPAEREALALSPCPSNCERVVPVWHDRQRRPEVREL